jgi:cell division protein FtsN
MGPFARNADADSVRAALQGREAVIRQSSEAGRVWVGHWVQVVGFKTRAQAEAARTRLAASGIPDAYILPDATDFPVSLGVFRARPSADRAAKQAKSLGYTTLMEERYQPGVNIWLWVRLPEGRKISPGEFKSASGQILRTESVACENPDT